MADTPRSDKGDSAEPAAVGADTPKKDEKATTPSRKSKATGPLVLGLGAVLVIGVLLYALGSIYFTGDDTRSGTTYSGTAAIGGPFTLTDHNGNTVTPETFAGKYMLIYFGYTFCPDICPTSLTDMADAIDELGADGDKVVPLLISVDPVRDTVEHLKEYVKFFHPRMVGLTGTPEAVKAAAKAYKVYYAKAKSEPGADPDDYLMDHSSIIYLMGPDGQFRAHFSHGTRAEAMAKRIREFM